MVTNNFAVRLEQVWKGYQDTNIIVVSNDVDVNLLTIQVFNNGVEINYSQIASGTITFVKSDNNTVQGNLTINSSNITYLMGTNEIAVPGTVRASIQLYGVSNERLTPARFRFQVENDLVSPTAVESTTEFGLLQQLKVELEAINVVSLTNNFNILKGDYDKTRIDVINVKSFGAVGNGIHDDAPAINAAIAYAEANKIMNVYIPKGQYLIDSESIIVHWGMNFFGDGSDDPYNKGGTRLYGGPNLTGPIVTNLDQLYHFRWTDMQIRNGNSHGAHLIDLGENSYIDRVMFAANGGDGLRIGNNGNLTPLFLGHIMCHKNNGAGLRLENVFSTTVQILYLSIDNNLDCGFAIDLGDVSSNVQLLAWKAERWNDGSPDFQLRHKTVFKFANLNGGYVDLGQGRLHIGSGVVDSDQPFILQTAIAGSNTGYVSWRYISKGNSVTDSAFSKGYVDSKSTPQEDIAFKDIFRKAFLAGLNAQITPARNFLTKIGRADTTWQLGKLVSLPNYDTPYGTLVNVGTELFVNVNNAQSFRKIAYTRLTEDLEFMLNTAGPKIRDKANGKNYRIIVTNGVLGVEEVT